VNRAQDQDLARLVAGDRVHPVDVASEEQVGDQSFEAVVLGGQESELLDVGDAVVRPFVLVGGLCPDSLLSVWHRPPQRGYALDRSPGGA